MAPRSNFHIPDLKSVKLWVPRADWQIQTQADTDSTKTQRAAVEPLGWPPSFFQRIALTFKIFFFKKSVGAHPYRTVARPLCSPVTGSSSPPPLMRAWASLSAPNIVALFYSRIFLYPNKNLTFFFFSFLHVFFLLNFRNSGGLIIVWSALG